MKTGLLLGVLALDMAALVLVGLLADMDLNGLAAVIAAIGSAIAAIYAARAHAVASIVKSDVGVVKDSMAVVKEDVHKVELATNSMKDQLVEATRVAAQATGEAKGREDQKAETKR